MALVVRPEAVAKSNLVTIRLRSSGGAVGCRLNVFCSDAVGLDHSFLSRGIAAGESFVGNGMWVTRVIDSDGYVIDFESPTDVPEETRLSEVT